MKRKLAEQEKKVRRRLTNHVNKMRRKLVEMRIR